jgi:hypothetical protein
LRNSRQLREMGTVPWTPEQRSRTPDHPRGREVIRAGRAVIRVKNLSG